MLTYLFYRHCLSSIAQRGNLIKTVRGKLIRSELSAEILCIIWFRHSQSLNRDQIGTVDSLASYLGVNTPHSMKNLNRRTLCTYLTTCL